MVLLVWPPPDHFWIGRNRGKFCGLSDAAGSPTSARKVPTEIAPARIPGPAAQTRMVSAAEFWPSQQELSRYLKYMARARIPEFESYMPRQAVGSLPPTGECRSKPLGRTPRSRPRDCLFVARRKFDVTIPLLVHVRGNAELFLSFIVPDGGLGAPQLDLLRSVSRAACHGKPVPPHVRCRARTHAIHSLSRGSASWLRR